MQQSKAVRITGTAMLALTVLFCVLPFLSMLSAALQPQGSMPEGIQFTAHRTGRTSSTPGTWQTSPAAAQQLHSGDRGRALRGDLLLARRLCLRSAQGAVQGPDLRAVPRRSDHSVRNLGHSAVLRDQWHGLAEYRLALILPLIGLNIPFGIVWMRSCFEQMPRDLIEAASIDGAAICACSVPFSCRWHCQPSPRSVF